jgi:hypothetical protein
LPADLHALPEIQEDSQITIETREETEIEKVNRKVVKGKWGLVLVEKRPGRFQQDSRTVLEKAQERKNKVNLEGMKGNTKSYNSFSVLAANEISKIADVTGISLGVDQIARDEFIIDIQTSDSNRANVFV